MASGLITEYLGQGLAADRPVTPDIGAGPIAVWYSTDDNELSVYADGGWHENVLGSGVGDMLGSNNLDDLTNAGLALTNLGLTANGKSLVTAADYAAMKVLLGLVIGTNVQAYDADLTTYASITPSSNVQSLLGAANYAAIKTLLALTIGTDIPARSPSIQSVASSATVTPTFADDQVNITAQAAALNLANPTGTAVDGWGIAIRIKDNGTARAIAYNGGSGSQYRAMGVTLPTTTVISKTLYLGMVWNAADSKWDVVAVAQEA